VNVSILVVGFQFGEWIKDWKFAYRFFSIVNIMRSTWVTPRLDRGPVDIRVAEDLSGVPKLDLCGGTRNGECHVLDGGCRRALSRNVAQPHVVGTKLRFVGLFGPRRRQDVHQRHDFVCCEAAPEREDFDAPLPEGRGQVRRALTAAAK
jgi:hypothetical protein